MARTMEELKTLIGVNLVRLRRRAGMTQTQLAEKLGYTDKAVSKWECGDAVPDIWVLTRVAEEFGVTVDDLLTPHTEPTEEPIQRMPRRRAIITVLAALLVWLIATVHRGAGFRRCVVALYLRDPALFLGHFHSELRMGAPDPALYFSLGSAVGNNPLGISIVYVFAPRPFHLDGIPHRDPRADHHYSVARHPSPSAQVNAAVIRVALFSPAELLRIVRAALQIVRTACETDRDNSGVAPEKSGTAPLFSSVFTGRTPLKKCGR